jgi:hypothetical protein
VPLYNQVVAIDAGTTQLTSGRTNSNGNLTLNFPAQPAGTKLSAVLAPVPALEPAHADLTAPSSATITTDAPALVAAGRYFSFSVRLTPAAQVPITVSGPHYSFTAKLDNNGVAIVRTLVPLGVTVLTVSTKNPIARTSFKVRGANPPTLKLTETSPQSLRATLTGPGPIANAHLSATPAGYTNVVPATTNAAGNAKFSFILLGASSSLIRVSYPGSATALPTSQTLRLTPLDSLGTGQILTPGTSRTSANGNYVLHLSTSGDLLLSRGSKTIWQTGTTCTSPHLVMLASGNAVLENAKGQAVWQTHTSGSPVMMLTVSNRGTVLATSDTKDYWTSVSPHGGRLL